MLFIIKYPGCKIPKQLNEDTEEIRHTYMYVYTPSFITALQPRMGLGELNNFLPLLLPLYAHLQTLDLHDLKVL
jgi:hypothetical protein